MKIDSVEVFEAVAVLIKIVLDHGFKIIEQKVNDYHFHELYFRLEGKYFKEIDSITIDKITTQKKIFSCSCDWSIIELVYE